MGAERDEKSNEFLLKLFNKTEEDPTMLYFNKYDIGEKCGFVDFETDESVLLQFVFPLMAKGILRAFKS